MRKTFLPGWEYNRALQEEPWRSRNSALPGEVLWNGSAQFWLFEAVVVTSDALANELEAAQRLDWATGVAFRTLKNDGIIETVDFASQKDSSDPVQRAAAEALLTSHAHLRREVPEHVVRALIARRDDSSLNFLLTVLLGKWAEAQDLVLSPSPSSVSTWRADDLPQGTTDAATLRRGEQPGDEGGVAIHEFLSALAFEVGRIGPSGRARVPGLELLRPPGAGVSREDKERQRRAQVEVEEPRISDLLAGDGEFAGDRGFVPYLKALENRLDDYRPINEQLSKDWRDGWERIRFLRDVAARHLWPQLHDEWLPELKANPERLPDFRRRIDRALQHERFSRYLTLPTRSAFAAAGPASVAAALSAWTSMHPVAVAASSGLAATTTAALAGRLLNTRGELTLFFQQARRGRQ